MDAESPLEHTFESPITNLCASCDTRCCTHYAVHVNAQGLHHVHHRNFSMKLVVSRLFRVSGRVPGKISRADRDGSSLRSIA